MTHNAAIRALIRGRIPPRAGRRVESCGIYPRAERGASDSRGESRADAHRRRALARRSLGGAGALAAGPALLGPQGAALGRRMRARLARTHRAVAPSRAMEALQVLEFIRDEDEVWNLPATAMERLRREFPDVAFESPRDRAEADRALSAADIVLGGAVRRDNFGAAKRLRWIQVTAAGVGHLLFPELVESDVVVTNGRGIHAVAMAEHTIGVILAFVRKL